MAIILDPAPPPNLWDAIERAIATNQELLLRPGAPQHLTNPQWSKAVGETCRHGRELNGRHVISPAPARKQKEPQSAMFIAGSFGATPTNDMWHSPGRDSVTGDGVPLPLDDSQGSQEG